MRYTPNFNRFNSLFDLVSYFCTEEKCEKFITTNRWNTQLNDEGERFDIMLSKSIGIYTYQDVKNVA